MPLPGRPAGTMLTRLAAAARRLAGVPRYEYRCRACGDTFELNRPMTESSAPGTCPQGHDDTVKLLSAVSVSGLAAGRERPAGPGGGGGCCGGACGCG
jgi:putative FmdB family regulatory protein